MAAAVCKAGISRSAVRPANRGKSGSARDRKAAGALSESREGSNCGGGEADGAGDENPRFARTFGTHACTKGSQGRAILSGASGGKEPDHHDIQGSSKEGIAESLALA